MGKERSEDVEGGDGQDRMTSIYLFLEDNKYLFNFFSGLGSRVQHTQDECECSLTEYRTISYLHQDMSLSSAPRSRATASPVLVRQVSAIS